LELQESIPAIRAQMELIQSLNSDDWWQDVTVGMLEHVRIQLRGLVRNAKLKVAELDEQHKVDIVDSGWMEYLTKELGMKDTDNVLWDLA